MFLSLGSEDPGTDAGASSFVLISLQEQMPGSFGSSSIPTCDTTQRRELRELNKWATANAKSCREMKWELRAYSELKRTLSQMSTSLLMVSSLEGGGGGGWRDCCFRHTLPAPVPGRTWPSLHQEPGTVRPSGDGNQPSGRCLWCLDGSLVNPLRRLVCVCFMPGSEKTVKMKDGRLPPIDVVFIKRLFSLLLKPCVQGNHCKLHFVKLPQKKKKRTKMVLEYVAIGVQT